MKRFIVWADCGGDGWSPEDCDTFQEAIVIRDQMLGMTQTVLVTELIPLIVSDGRSTARLDPAPDRTGPGIETKK